MHLAIIFIIYAYNIIIILINLFQIQTFCTFFKNGTKWPSSCIISSSNKLLLCDEVSCVCCWFDAIFHGACDDNFSCSFFKSFCCFIIAICGTMVRWVYWHWIGLNVDSHLVFCNGSLNSKQWVIVVMLVVENRKHVTKDLGDVFHDAHWCHVDLWLCAEWCGDIESWATFLWCQNLVAAQLLHLQWKVTLITSDKSDLLEFLLCSTEQWTFFWRLKNSADGFCGTMQKSQCIICYDAVFEVLYLFSVFWPFLLLQNKWVVSFWLEKTNVEWMLGWMRQSTALRQWKGWMEIAMNCAATLVAQLLE